MSTNNYMMTLHMTTDVDARRVLSAMVRNLTLPMFLLWVVEATSWEDFQKAVVVVKEALDWADDMKESGYRDADAEMEVAANHRGFTIVETPGEEPDPEPQRA